MAPKLPPISQIILLPPPLLFSSHSFVTRNLLTVPIFGEGSGGEDSVLGVLQVLNKIGGSFETKDESKAVLLTRQISNAMAVHVHREQEKAESKNAAESPRSVGRGSVSPKSARSRRVSYAVDGSPVQRPLSPIPGLTIGSDNGAFGSPGLYANRIGSPRGKSPSPSSSPLGSSRSLALNNNNNNISGGVDVKTLERLGEFFRRITSDESLSGEVPLCGAVRGLGPKLLNMKSVSLWLFSPSEPNQLWSQSAAGSERYVVEASEGVLGECVLGRRVSKIIKPSWTDMGTMRIPDISVTSSVGFVMCAPVEVGGEVLGAVQCVEGTRTKIEASDVQITVLLGRALGFAVMLNRVASKVGVFEELSHRMDVANRANLGVGIACGEGGYGEIAGSYVEPHLLSLLEWKCNVQLYLADQETSVLAVAGGGGKVPDMVMGDEGSMVGRSGWLGEVVCYDSNPAYANERGEEDGGVNKSSEGGGGGFSPIKSPVKSMLNLR